MALCECGCGKETGLAPQKCTSRGWIKGQPVRYIQGHNFKTKPIGCSIPGCDQLHQARGWCHTHYETWRRNGDPLFLKNKRSGEGHIMENGYVRTMEKGVVKFDHTRIAEEVLGKSIPGKACLHHIDENPTNNSKDNLVLCENAAYHRLLHLRTKAIRLGFPPNYRKCRFCKEYDDPKNLLIRYSGVHHKECCNAYYREKRRTK